MTSSVTERAAGAVTPARPGREVSREEGMEIIDRQAWRYLGISGEEFLHRWRRGEYDVDPDQPGVMDLIMLLPFAREEREQS